MSGIRRFLPYLIYVLPALLIAVGLPNYAPTVAPVEALLFGAMAFLLGAIIHLAVALGEAQRITRSRISGALEALSHGERMQRRLEGELAQMRHALIDLQSRPAQDVGEVVAEVKVLQSLVERLYSARSGTSGIAAAPVPPSLQPSTDPAGGSPAVPPQQQQPANPNAAAGSLPMPPIAEGLNEQNILDLVREGLRENAVELALQPIVSLPQRKRRYFECLSRVRTGDGKIIVPEQYLDVAERYGLLTAIDNLLLFRCIQTLRRIRKSNANVGFFLNISPHTLADRGFFRDFIQLMAQNIELAPALVFEFPQRSLAQADDSLWRDLDRLAQMGFRFSMDQVADLDIDASDLSARHFRFLKLDAARVMDAARQGLFGADPKMLKRTLDSYAIDLIVERIETESMLRELLDLNIDFGQGFLFGEPRIAKSDSTGPLH